MTSELRAVVSKITVTQSRIDAVVILGTTRYGVTLDPSKPDNEAVQTAVVALRDALIEAAKSDIAEHLENDISASTKRTLTS